MTPARLLMCALAGSAILAGAWLWFWLGYGDRAEDVSNAGTSEWKTIEYQGVKVDIPASWEPLEMDDCEFQFEVWTPPEVTGCDWTGGVAFYGSSTFDPAHGPGVRRVKSPDEPEWGGHTYAGDFAIYASTDDRDVVERVLRSAR